MSVSDCPFVLRSSSDNIVRPNHVEDHLINDAKAGNSEPTLTPITALLHAKNIESNVIEVIPDPDKISSELEKPIAEYMYASEKYPKGICRSISNKYKSYVQ